MTLSRRSFFSGLAVALAAPAIVRVESLMKLAPTEIIRPEGVITQVDILYGKMFVRPKWTLDEFSERILAPMIDNLSTHLEDALRYGISSAQLDYNKFKPVSWADMLMPVSPTHSIE